MHKHTITAILLISFVFITGFNTENAIVPQSEILSGGPPKDGIPAILEPKFVDPGNAAYLEDSDDVIGLKIGNESKAYRMKQLRARPGVHSDVVGARAIQIEISPAGDVIAVRDQEGRAIAATYSYWFAWQAFHPNTGVYEE